MNAILYTNIKVTIPSAILDHVRDLYDVARHRSPHCRRRVSDDVVSNFLTYVETMARRPVDLFYELHRQIFLINHTRA